MSWRAELHDSEISAIERSSETTVLEFSRLYLHESSNPGVDPGTVWIQAARLHFRNAGTSPVDAEFPASICDGEIKIDDITHSNSFSVPFEVSGRIECNLELTNGREIRIAGNAAWLETLGTPEFLETFPGR